MVKSPVLAAIISVFLPGVGHFYCGAWTRGLVILILSYFAFGLASLLGSVLGLVAILAIDALVAYDAWKTAQVESARAVAEAAAPAEITWIHWVWGLVRAGWIAAFLLVFGVTGLLSLFSALRGGHWLIAGSIFLPTIFFLALCWLVARSTWRVLKGTEAMSAGAVRNEIGATIFCGAIVGLMFMMVYPSFKDLTRKSGEGDIKGNLGQLRFAFSEYRAAKSENPPSLDALLGGPDLAQMPELWRTGPMPHKRDRGIVILPDGKPTDSGKWAYAVGTSTPIFVDCTHTDSRGLAWHAY